MQSIAMRIIAKRTLKDFWESSPNYTDAQASLEAWYFEALKASWSTPQEIKSQYRSANILKKIELYLTLLEINIVKLFPSIIKD